MVNKYLQNKIENSSIEHISKALANLIKLSEDNFSNYKLLNNCYLAKVAYSLAIDMHLRRSKQKYCCDLNDKQEGLAITHECAILILRSIIYAIRSDDKVDRDEINDLISVWSHIFSDVDVLGYVAKIMTEDIDVNNIKSAVLYKEEALNIYFISALILHNPNFIEQSYLDMLSSSLDIKPSLKKTIDDYAKKAKITKDHSIT